MLAAATIAMSSNKTSRELSIPGQESATSAAPPQIQPVAVGEAAAK
jgi:hypothetical protein